MSRVIWFPHIWRWRFPTEALAEQVHRTAGCPSWGLARCLAEQLGAEAQKKGSHAEICQTQHV